jgi:hypothetical protein
MLRKFEDSQQDATRRFEVGRSTGGPTPTVRAQSSLEVQKMSRSKGVILAVAIAAFAANAASAQRPVAGWASQTGFRNAQSVVQKRMVTNAIAATAGNPSSGPSSVTSPFGQVWLTDVAGGDGIRMRAAIADYDTFVRKGGNLAKVRATMMQRFAGSNYGPAQVNQLCDHIIAEYTARSVHGCPVIPQTDQQTLDFLDIRKQCLEWADSIAMASGGRPKNYGSAGVANPADFRPGMLLMRTDASHTMIILDIAWSAQGQPLAFKVAEANASQMVWQNPLGQVPWQRTATSGRIVNFDPRLLRIVSTETP